VSAPAYNIPTPQAGPETAPAVEARCPNCGTAATRNFCPECGQECISVRLSLRDLASEFLDDHVGWSTRVPRTLGRLLFQPGVLTRDFIDGRRVRYLSPLRLYLSLSVIFFLVVASPPSWSSKTSTTKVTTSRDASFHFVRTTGTDSATSDSDSVASRAARIARADSLEADIARHPPDTTTFKGRMKLMFLRRNAVYARMNGTEAKDLFLGGITRRMPNVMFVLLPLFAFFLKLLYWRRRRFYAEHLVFGLHTHAVAYALLTLSILTPWPSTRKWLVIACALYFVLALRRVYGGGIVKTLAKTVALGTAYVTVIVVSASALGIFIFLFG
jgi:predicted RNA-binding Zn-ribbon protein involved in translation (DUF1610 family)